MELSRTFQTRAQALEVYRSQLCRQLLFVEVFEAVRPDTPIKLTLRISETNSVIKLAAKAIKMIRKSEAAELGYGTRAGVILDVPITQDIVAPFREFFLSEAGSSHVSAAASAAPATPAASAPSTQGSRVKVSYSSDIKSSHSQNPKISFSSSASQSSQFASASQPSGYGASQPSGYGASQTTRSPGHSRFGIVSPEILARAQSQKAAQEASAQPSRLNAVPKEEPAYSPHSRLIPIPNDELAHTPRSGLNAIPKDEPAHTPHSRLNAIPKEEPAYSPHSRLIPIPKEDSAYSPNSRLNARPKSEPSSPHSRLIPIPTDEPAYTPNSRLNAVPKEESYSSQYSRVSAVPKEPAPREPVSQEKSASFQSVASVFDDLENEVIAVSPYGEAVSQAHPYESGMGQPARQSVSGLHQVDSVRMSSQQNVAVRSSASVGRATAPVQSPSTQPSREKLDSTPVPSSATPVPSSVQQDVTPVPSSVTPVPQRNPFDRLNEISSDSKRLSETNEPVVPKNATTLQRDSVAPRAQEDVTPVPQRNPFDRLNEISSDSKRLSETSEPVVPKNATTLQRDSVAPRAQEDVTPVPQRNPFDRLNEISSEARRVGGSGEPIVPKSATTLMRESVASRALEDVTPVPQQNPFDRLNEIPADARRVVPGEPVVPKGATTLQREGINRLNLELDDELGLPDSDDVVAGIMPTKKVTNDSKMIKLTLNDAFNPDDFELDDIDEQPDENVLKLGGDNALHAMEGFIFEDDAGMSDIEIDDDLEFATEDADMIDLGQPDDVDMFELDPKKAENKAQSEDEDMFEMSSADDFELPDIEDDPFDADAKRVSHAPTGTAMYGAIPRQPAENVFNSQMRPRPSSLQEATPSAPVKGTSAVGTGRREQSVVSGLIDAPRMDSGRYSIRGQSGFISSLNAVPQSDRQTSAVHAGSQSGIRVAEMSAMPTSEISKNRVRPTESSQLNASKTGFVAGRCPLGNIGVMAEEQVIRQLDKHENTAEKGSVFALFNLSPMAAQADIRKVYNDTVRVLHPDCYDQSHFSEKTIQRLEDAYQRFNEANQIIQHPIRRKLYIEASRLEGARGGMSLKQYQKWMEMYRQKNAVNIRMAASLVEQIRESLDSGLLEDAAQQLKLALQYDPFNFEAQSIQADMANK